jgi:AmmeMemoRadiSam system protein A
MSGPGLGDDERAQLLALARESIAASLEGRALRSLPLAPQLREKGGAFVTLAQRSDGELRGCIGFVEAVRPLSEAVAEAARLAATEDRRFQPLRLAELANLHIEISVLTTPVPVRAEEIVVGTHGLMIRHAGASGLLLPQVPVEHGWDRESFLEHTCRKAGLPPGAWRLPGAELLSFTAVVFSEPSD